MGHFLEERECINPKCNDANMLLAAFYREKTKTKNQLEREINNQEVKKKRIILKRLGVCLGCKIISESNEFLYCLKCKNINNKYNKKSRERKKRGEKDDIEKY